MTNPGTDPLNPQMHTEQSYHGFEVQKVTPLDAIGGYCYALAHRATGARYIHISRDDGENAFGVGLKTVPQDASGVAHILEHTVLCGSKAYPVRDPFFAMLKRSLSTFMNAFTASDWTLYPFATQNQKDFYNLLDVYLDAVFFPRLDALSFRQEGHRVEFEPEADGREALVFKGVVYNEMKGAMSSPDQVLGRSLLNALYPDTTYRHNSGGDPRAIPDLTHDGLQQFHQRHYHPSNAYFYSYGSFPLADHLAFIEEKVLQHFSAIDPQTTVANQLRWTTPREVTYYYPIAPGEDAARRCQIGLGWLTADIQDTFEVLALSLLEQILLGNQASPLRQALMQSELGSSLADASGFDADNRDTLFFCGLKNVAPEDAPAIEKLILTTLETLATEGIDPALIESAIHQIEFHRREITNSPYPYGLKLLLLITSTWLHGGQPESLLDLDPALQRLQRALDRGSFFEERIRSYFLDNPHRVRFQLLPDDQMQSTEAARETARLEKIETRLTDAERATIREDAQALKQRQETQEDLAVLPTLKRSDIPPVVPTVAASPLGTADGIRCYDLPTGGIFYLTGALRLPPLADADLPLTSFFAYAFTRLGTRRRDYADLSRRIDRYTGGIDLALQTRTLYDPAGTPQPFLTLNGKCLERHQPRLFELLAELAGEVVFTDLAQLRRVLLEYRSGLERAVVNNGHRLAISLASRNLTPSARLHECWYGVHQLRAIKALSDQVAEADMARLAEDLSRLHRQLFQPRNLELALTGGSMSLEAALPRVADLKTHLPAPCGTDAETIYTTEQERVREGWQTSTAVAFVAQAFACVRYQHADAPALAAMAKMLRSLYLHREIREKGGAYGGFALYNPEDGIFALGSYRDPHIVRTIQIFGGASDFIAAGDFTNEDIKEAILQVCADIDKPDAPGAAARKAFFRQMLGLTDEARQQFKARLLALDRPALQAAAQRYFVGAPENRATAVIASGEALDRANVELGEQLLEKHEI